MRCFSWIVALALALLLTADGLAADKAKKKPKPVQGVITEIKKDEGKDTGTITVKTVPNKKDATATSEEKKFKVTSATKIDKMVGKKKDAQTSEAKFSELQKDVAVAVVPKAGEEGVAEAIHIHAAKKKK
jgi:hypothetical protein